MFGIKKILAISNEKSRSSIEKDSNNSYSGDDSKFIYYANTEEFISQLEIYIKPNNYPDKKILVIIKCEEDLKELNLKIRESLKSISEFKNISGLKIENLYKVQNGSKIFLPNKGIIKEYLNSGDIIYCDIVSDEYWIKIYFKIIAYNYKNVVKLEYKLQKRMKFKRIKLILLKAGINIFMDELKKNYIDNSFNYFLKEIKFYNKKLKKSNFGYEFTDINKKLKYLDNKNEILVNLKFGIFEELVHEQLTTINPNKNENNYLRLNEYCNLDFEELLSSKKFEQELGTVQDISQEFLTSQYNDLNTTFLFYNIKKAETVDDYMYNMINLSNSYEIEDDEEEDDGIDFEGDTSFGKFYSDDPSKFFGNITSIKKTKNNYIKRHNKFDSNIIIIAPFLFKLIKKNKKDLNSNSSGNSSKEKIFRTFAKQNIKQKSDERENQDLNNIFIAPLSLDISNNILKDDKNNLLYNNIGIDYEENDLILDTGNNINKKKKQDNDLLKNIFGIDNEIQEDKRFTLKFDDLMSHNSKRSIFSLMRLSKQSNCCNDLYNYFSQIKFIENLKKKYKNYISKKIIEKIIVPESRDYEYVDKDFLSYLKSKENEEDNSLIIQNKKLIIFLCIFFVYYLVIIITNNIEFINWFI